MNFHLQIPVVPSTNQIEIRDKICFMGSCFSDEIGILASQHGLNAMSNPFGTVFHPIPMSNILKGCISNHEKYDMIRHNNLVYDWNSSHLFYSLSETEHKQKVKNTHQKLKDQLKGKSWLFITLGTSVGYRLKETNRMVANCHKQDQNLFEKENTPFEVMYAEWFSLLTDLFAMNSELNVVFTVSPVRHVKDGLITNNVSKSNLFVLIDRLKSDFPIRYYPSYEILIDALRDYRFYKKDLVHPNELAIDCVWSHFIETFMSKSNASILKRVSKIKAAEGHQIMTADRVEGEKLKSWISKEKKKIVDELGEDFKI